MRGSRDRTLHWTLPLAAIGALMLSAATAGPALAEQKASLEEALKNGKVTVNLRYRFENVSDDSPDKDAHASTLRTVLGYRTRAYKGFSFQIEAENVTAVGDDLYDNVGSGTANNRMQDRSVVADPAITEINQALLRYQGDKWQVAAGRQEIVLGDSRFIGNVGWRQNHQNFDAFRIDNSSLGGLRFTYAYVDRVNRITGDSRGLEAHLINAGFELQNAGKFTLYGYLVDWQEGLSSMSTATYGLEFAGKRRLGGSQKALLYEAEYAEQSDYGDNRGDFESGYTSLMLGLSTPKVTMRLAREVLEGDGRGRFQTPLATLHKFNGWADKFLSTPLFGLEDLYLQLNGKIGEVGWLVKYHDFEAESAALSYGQELDLQLVYTCPKGVQLGLKGALYDADLHSFDTDKWMLWVSWRL